MWNPIILDVECIVCNKSLQKINHVPRDASRKMGKIIKLNNNRRLRTPNWSLEEKQYLLELIKQRKEVVVTKTNNGPNHYEEKDVAWNEILRELSVKFGCKFTGSSIKKVKTQWQNMKRIAREEIALNGPQIQNYSRLSLEVCNILELVKDGVVKGESENLNETITANIEIKTECIDEEIDNPNCSGMNTTSASVDTDTQGNKTNTTSHVESSASSVSDQISENNDFDAPEDISPAKNKRNVSALTDKPYEEINKIINPFHRELQEYFKYTAAEKQMKMETLKEERQVIRAMRETAELNKIIAEQKLKHVLWVKQQEMSMTTGDPGSGVGRGGGGGGSIREAGGAFGKMEAAREDQYFYEKQKEQLQHLKSQLSSEISFHEKQIKHHKEAIKRHQEKMDKWEKKE
ncbi:unnamed protein product [Chrysodeixis includens]|uniref:Regulatory protein zeste n=1 Tax=Chrysodeixis includens TaxID=689277 RepID=A0A9N8PZ73_CHRIL|nr:unnamed protein product [Chrysodeixis includens]